MGYLSESEAKDMLEWHNNPGLCGDIIEAAARDVSSQTSVGISTELGVGVKSTKRDRESNENLEYLNQDFKKLRTH